MTYPKTNPSVRAATLAYVPNVSVAVDAYESAVAKQSIALLSVGVFEALSPHVDKLDEAGKRVLAGVAFLISEAGWFGLRLEASRILFGIEFSLAEGPVPTPSPREVD